MSEKCPKCGAGVSTTFEEYPSYECGRPVGYIGLVYVCRIRELEVRLAESARLLELVRGDSPDSAWKANEPPPTLDDCLSLLSSYWADVMELDAVPDDQYFGAWERAAAGPIGDLYRKLAEAEAVIAKLPNCPPWMVGRENCDNAWDAYEYWESWIRKQLSHSQQDAWYDGRLSSLDESLYAIMSKLVVTREAAEAKESKP